MIIDIHVHPPLIGDRKELSSMDKTVELAKRFGIEKLVLLGDVISYGCRPDESSVKKINDFTIAMLKRHPGVFIGFCFLNPLHSREFIYQEIERCVKEGFKGIKLHIAVNARNKCLDPIMEKAEELNLVVLQHAWDTTIINDREHQSDPADVAELAARFPRVKIIMAHLTGCGIRGVLEVKSLPNVYVDTSGGLPFSGIVEYAVEKLGAERVLFGSDMEVRHFSTQLGRIYGAKIKESERKLILGLNAKKLLCL